MVMVMYVMGAILSHFKLYITSPIPGKMNFDEVSYVHILSFALLVTIVTTILCVANIKRNHDRCFIIAADVERNNRTGFYGRWVHRDNTLKQTCNFPFQSKCCQKRQHLKFVFNDDKLNRVDPIREIHEILNSKSLLLIGDSLIREFYTGIKELLFLNETIGQKTNLSNLNYTKADRIHVNASGHVVPSNLPDIVSRHFPSLCSTKEFTTTTLSEWRLFVSVVSDTYFIGSSTTPQNRFACACLH